MCIYIYMYMHINYDIIIDVRYNIPVAISIVYVLVKGRPPERAGCVAARARTATHLEGAKGGPKEWGL